FSPPHTQKFAAGARVKHAGVLRGACCERSRFPGDTADRALAPAVNGRRPAPPGDQRTLYCCCKLTDSHWRLTVSTARREAIAAVNNYKPVDRPWNIRDQSAGEFFGANVFCDAVMKERLSKDVYKALQNTIKRGAKLNPDVADEVAAAMKKWAIE